MISIFVAVVYAVAEDRGSRRKDWAQYETDVTKAEADVAAAKTRLRTVKNQLPGLPGPIVTLLIIAVIIAFLWLSEALHPRPSYWRDH